LTLVFDLLIVAPYPVRAFAMFANSPAVFVDGSAGCQQAHGDLLDVVAAVAAALPDRIRS